jgi:hypothetical protein
MLKLSNINFKDSNRQFCIAAHFQGAQNPTHKANLAKELQSPTHGKYLLIQTTKHTLYHIIKYLAGLREKKQNGKIRGFAPYFFRFQIHSN